MGRLTSLLLASGLLVSLGGAASAVPILAVGGSVNANGVTITLEDVVTGAPSGAYLTAGATGGTDLILIFSATADADGAVDEIGVATVFCDNPSYNGLPVGVCPDFPVDYGRNSTGAGAGPAGDVEIDTITGTADTRIFQFDGNPDAYGDNDGFLDSGETSDLFWVSYAAGDVLFDGKHFINFMISQGATDITQTVQLIPEPSTALLMVLGIGGLIAAGRRRS